MTSHYCPDGKKLVDFLQINKTGLKPVSITVAGGQVDLWMARMLCKDLQADLF